MEGMCLCFYMNAFLETRDYKRQMFLTVWAEIFIRAVGTVLLPITGVCDVNTAAVIALELVV